ncbi:hypothetical protein RFI_20740 [Reticulomyxa filosa]|uniref:Sulphur transport domain-containing protein n=1 Tax=Reticulomyxa filosa TaxID=46433 RepID=X6MSD4_RETFI|nr:hypothetical protein RFI_20740 [Reticulomyxa filosa]|eukprot:ETO16596.1 hypothetical protein RFI_20740 [Reticulomyxa filosa]
MIIGGALLGTGMTVCGACPGMVLIQTGAGVTTSVYTLTGGMVGAFAFGLCEPLLRPWISKADIRPKFVEHMSKLEGVFTYPVLAFALGCALHTFAFAIEVLVPWKSELPEKNVTTCNIFTCRYWPPHLAGAIIGLLQIPCLLVFGSTLGIIFFFFFFFVCYVTSAIVGSFVASAIAAGSPAPNRMPMSTQRAFVGGFLMLFGARLAQGCTSGHGISGLGLLSVASFACVAAMFAGGIVVTLIAFQNNVQRLSFQFFNGYEHFQKSVRNINIVNNTFCKVSFFGTFVFSKR